MPKEEKQEGLVLRAINYRDRQRIITVFTKDRGLISLIVKGIHRKRLDLMALTTPLSQAEYHYTIGRSDLYQFRDGTLLACNLELRESALSLETGGQIIQALLATQWPGKPAPLLYQLTLAYLKQLPHFPDPKALLASYWLKLLKYEGNLSLQSHCTHCEKPPSHLYKGESLCLDHAPYSIHPLKSDEWVLLTTLLETKDFSLIKTLTISSVLKEKLKEMLFNDQVRSP